MRVYSVSLIIVLSLTTNIFSQVNFVPRTVSTDAFGPRSVYAIDVDGDSDIDVLSASNFDNRIYWYENDGNQNFTSYIITTNAVGTGTYQFGKDDNQIKNDTLIATSLLHNNYGDEQFERKFSFDQNQSIKYDYFDAGKTVAAVVGTAALIALTVVAANSMKNMFKFNIKLPSNIFEYRSPY